MQTKKRIKESGKIGGMKIIVHPEMYQTQDDNLEQALESK